MLFSIHDDDFRGYRHGFDVYLMFLDGFSLPEELKNAPKKLFARFQVIIDARQILAFKYFGNF